MSEIERLRAQNADLLKEAELSDDMSAALLLVCDEAMALLKRVGDAEILSPADRQQCLASFGTWRGIVEQFHARLKMLETQNAATSDSAH